MAQKVAKQDVTQIRDYESELVSSIFKGCSMFMNGFETEPAVELRRLICINGGSSPSQGIVTLGTTSITHFGMNEPIASVLNFGDWDI
jgi:hypothetical protein